MGRVSDFHFEVEVVGVDADMAYTLGFERFTDRSPGAPWSRCWFA